MVQFSDSKFEILHSANNVPATITQPVNDQVVMEGNVAKYVLAFLLTIIRILISSAFLLIKRLH